MSFAVLDVMGVDDPGQAIEVDLRATFSWTDPRLTGLEGCRYGIGEVWFPVIELANSSNLRRTFQRSRNQVRVGPEGQVSYLQRYTGTISTYHNLRSFPFDSQAFEINLASTETLPDQLRLVADVDNTGIAGRLNIEGWSIHGVTLTDGLFRVLSLNREASVLTLTLHAERNPTYYLFRVLLPLSLVVAMSWVIFWVPPERFEFQIGLGATAMLTAIAFSLSISARLPTLGYLTTLDVMLIWAVFLVFLSMAEALVAGLLVIRDRAALAVRLDQIARVVFPIALFAGWAVLVL